MAIERDYSKQFAAVAALEVDIEKVQIARTSKGDRLLLTLTNLDGITITLALDSSDTKDLRESLDMMAQELPEFFM